MGVSPSGGEIVGLDHVQLAAPPGCEEAAREFFGTVLGLVEVSKPEPLANRGGVWFQVGQQQLHIGIERNFVPAQKAHPAFRLDAADAVRELAARIEGAGARVQWDDSLPDSVRFYVADPWGNRIEILARVVAEGGVDRRPGGSNLSSGVGAVAERAHGIADGDDRRSPTSARLRNIALLLAASYALAVLHRLRSGPPPPGR